MFLVFPSLDLSVDPDLSGTPLVGGAVRFNDRAVFSLHTAGTLIQATRHSRDQQLSPSAHADTTPVTFIVPAADSLEGTVTMDVSGVRPTKSDGDTCRGFRWTDTVRFTQKVAVAGIP